MAKINGLELKAAWSETCEDDSTIKICGLYLGGKKIATLLFQEKVPEAENSVQAFVRYPYSEEKLRTAIEARHGGPDYTLENLVQELVWLDTMEHEYLTHAGTRSGGMLALSFETCQVTLGIPPRLSQADEDEVLSSCQGKIEEYKKYYGELEGYRIFRDPGDFLIGEELDDAALRR